MAYLARTTPRDPISTVLQEFDTLVRSAFEEITKAKLTTEQCLQAFLPRTEGGLGMRSIYTHADAAYVPSRSATYAKCAAVSPTHAWEAEEIQSHLYDATVRLNADGAAYPLGSTPDDMRQQKLSTQLEEHGFKSLLSAADQFGKAHIKSHQCGTSDWMGAMPDNGLDTHTLRRGSYLATNRINYPCTSGFLVAAYLCRLA